jgi:hypothetical protein
MVGGYFQIIQMYNVINTLAQEAFFGNIATNVATRLSPFTAITKSSWLGDKAQSYSRDDSRLTVENLGGEQNIPRRCRWYANPEFVSLQ